MSSQSLSSSVTQLAKNVLTGLFDTVFSDDKQKSMATCIQCATDFDIEEKRALYYM